jgi:hypothetical protein
MKFIVAIIFLSVLVSSCGGYRSEVNQNSEKGFLKFKSSVPEFSFVIDEGVQMNNDPKIDQYEIKPGKHNVKVYRDDKLIVNRIIFVDNQTIFEIEVP